MNLQCTPSARTPTNPCSRGANTRVFNRLEAPSGGRITLDQTMGVVTLKPGTYHITVSSIVTSYDPATDGKVTNQPRAWGGYCRLRYRDKPECTDTPIAIGTISPANMLPSLILPSDSQPPAFPEAPTGRRQLSGNPGEGRLALRPWSSASVFDFRSMK